MTERELHALENLEEENQRLLQELEAESQRLRELEAENQRLQELADKNQKLHRLIDENVILKSLFEKMSETTLQDIGSYFTNEVLENLLTTRDGLRIGGERKKVTILFSDLRRSTEISGFCGRRNRRSFRCAPAE